MKLTMNQPYSKCISMMFVAVFGVLCAAACPENHFRAGDSCCLNCLEGEYVAHNCSDGPGGHTGVQCNPCRRCEDTGEITVSDCMQFSDARCARKVRKITSYECVCVAAVALFLVVIVATCFFWRISKPDGSSSREPLHISEEKMQIV